MYILVIQCPIICVQEAPDQFMRHCFIVGNSFFYANAGLLLPCTLLYNSSNIVKSLAFFFQMW